MNSEISYAAASRNYKAGRYLDSIKCLNALLDEQRTARIYALLARNFEQLDMKADAASTFMLAAKQDSSKTDEYLHEAMSLYFELGEDDIALSIGNRLLKTARRNPDVAFIIASILMKRGENQLAGSFKQVLAGSDKQEHMILAARLLYTDWQPDSREHYEATRRILNKIPANNAVRLLYLAICREHSKYDAIEVHQKIIDKALAAGELDFLKHDQPFFNLHWTGNEQYNSLIRLGTGRFTEQQRAFRRSLAHEWDEKKIRIGYVSADFWEQHATMKLLRGVFEHHDRERFEITLFCNTPDRHLDLGTQDRSAWGKIVTVRGRSTNEIVQEIRQHNIDILVDLKGYTVNHCAEVFNRPAAPVHVGWLGYPGSTVGLDLDYIIGDSHVLPDSSKPWYGEKFCRLPECYQPNDPARRRLPVATPRSELGLPENAFVFASFNTNRKLTPAMIESWATILKRTPDSVIWLMHNNPESRTNIARAFNKHGVAANRLHFMGLVSFEDHINRIPAADLGLDTYPVNGHTTTSEQLWAGLPVLTVKGTNFASRVSESLLHAIGLPEMIAENTEAYIEQAVALYNDRQTLKRYGERLVDNRFVKPLFDCERFTRHLESAYEMMARRAQDGIAPDHFDVPGLPERSGAFMTPDA